jgi:2,3-bisphosphoglycerate-independent phosphoglycerate mutase
MERNGLMIILDGYGVGTPDKFNAIQNANTPFMDSLKANYPNGVIKTSGLAVGLPDGQMGNSEVGHTNIGAGRVVYQDYTRISKDITDGNFAKNEGIKNIMETVKKNNSTLHLIGLFSDGGVHSDISHLKAIIKVADEYNINDVQIETLLDGRDTPPQSSPEYFEDFYKFLAEFPDRNYRIGMVSGRFYAMDRDKRWDRVQKSYDMLTGKVINNFNSWKEGIDNSYNNGENDEFVMPFTIKGFTPIKDNDAIFFFNFRSDRVRELSHAFLDDDFTGFDREEKIKLSDYLTMTEYEESLIEKTSIAYPSVELNDTMGEIISKAGFKQLRIAETEKYAHVTFFFNGGVEDKFEGEDRILVPSPKSVRTYDEKPSMSIYEVTEKLTEAIKLDKYKLIVLNYANGDMVGHTGIYSAAIEAIEAIDDCLSKIIPVAIEHNYVMTIAADHGNSEEMWNYDANAPHTQHTTGVVPLIVVNAPEVKSIKENGALKDLSPTMLDLLNIKQPKAMTGETLIIK